jgi:hypothetical protein
MDSQAAFSEHIVPRMVVNRIVEVGKINGSAYGIEPVFQG